MKCPVCWQNPGLTRTGRFPLHRTTDAGEYGFCPMSGEPVPVAEHTTRTKESITC